MYFVFDIELFIDIDFFEFDIILTKIRFPCLSSMKFQWLRSLFQRIVIYFDSVVFMNTTSLI